ncbi:hypothetical protein AVEN_72107-1 [Araneus ventricosus]|uniref:Uncharacterized protein n=1 Tax=Araneus ventricosus TaxID=182803 RepID=A0A4Y2RNT0_ARAVE|nr:hypothetical protein AVEN_72107-1 [Araneus ventricosus]
MYKCYGYKFGDESEMASSVGELRYHIVPLYSDNLLACDRLRTDLAVILLAKKCCTRSSLAYEHSEKENGFAAENPQLRTERTWWSASSKVVGMLDSIVFLMRQHYELSDNGQSERESIKYRLHRFPSILAAP